MRNSKAVKLVPKLFSLHPVIHQRIINHFIEDKGMTSESDVVRQALVYMHEKTFPDYVYRETYATTEKKAKRVAEDSWNSMSDAEYATTVLQAPIYETEDGTTKMVVVHTIGKSVIPFPLIGLKEFMTTRQDMVNFHHNALKKHSIEERLFNDENLKGLLRSRYHLVV